MEAIPFGCIQEQRCFIEVERVIEFGAVKGWRIHESSDIPHDHSPAFRMPQGTSENRSRVPLGAR